MNQDIYTLVEHLNGQVFEISYMLLAQARAVANVTGGRVVALLLGHQVAGLATDLGADEVLYIDHPALETFTAEAYQKVLEGLLVEKEPRLVLFGETTIGSDTAGGLSSQLKLPLLSLCVKVEITGAELKYTSQICGGKILEEGQIPEDKTALVSILPGAFKAEMGKSASSPHITSVLAPDLSGLKTTVKQIIEPENGGIDITKESILVSVGRGIQQKDNIELAEDLAGALGTVVSGSRPVIDQGWLPTAQLVGKSGKAVKPKVYLAFGISGAPEHTEAITGSEMIIAINTDPAAPIFNLAKYGAVVDALDLLPVLTDQVRQAKGD